MTKKIIAIITIAIVFIMAFPFSAFAETHSCTIDPVPVYDNTSHWNVCMYCSKKHNVGAHYGGTATTTEKAKCSYCMAEYGSYASSGSSGGGSTTHTHSYIWQTVVDGIHKQACACGVTLVETLCTDANKDGSCDLCNGVPTPTTATIVMLYTTSGEYIGTSYTLRETPRFWYNKNSNGSLAFVLQEGVELNDGGNGYYNGTVKLAETDVGFLGLSLDKDYNISSSGDLNFVYERYYYLEKGKTYIYYTLTENDVANAPTQHTHTFDVVPIYDDYTHWRECVCGEKTESEAHYGGTATCSQKARCMVCNKEYGSLSAHIYGDDQMTCVVCGENKSKVFYEQGYKIGYNEGYDYGYEDGYQACLNDLANSDLETSLTFKEMISSLMKAPSQFIQGMLDFDVFGVNIAHAVKVLFTLLLVVFVVTIIVRFII